MSEIIDSKIWTDRILQVLLFVESTNRCLAEKWRKQQRGHRPVLDAVLETRKQLLQQGGSWVPNVDLAVQLRQVGKLPPADSEMVNRISKFLLQSAQIEDKDGSGEWNVSGNPNLPEPVEPMRLKSTGRIHDCYGSLEFTTGTHREGDATATGSGFRKKYVRFFDQPLNPIAVTQNFLLDELDSDNIDTADFYIQAAFRRLFRLRYTDITKLVLSDLCRSVNDNVFEFSSRSVRRTFQSRSATLTTGMLVYEIEESIGRTCGGIEECDRFIENRRLMAVGLLMFMRFCRALRVRYSWFDAPIKDHDVISGVNGKQCMTALRPLEFMYFQKKIFGSISEIPGLNFIFGGAVLPRTSGGRSLVVSGTYGSGKTTLALQKLVNVANHGGLGIYFSFEESYQLIFDRLIAFGLLDSRRYLVDQAGEDIGDKIRAHFSSEASRGLLLLFGVGKEGRYYLEQTIRDIGDAARDIGHGANWRALVIDSINALALGREADRRLAQNTSSEEIGSGALDGQSRLRLHQLIEVIEEEGFLGIVLSEENGDDRFKYLLYLGDTVIRLGLAEGRLRRWLEVAKARGQNFHQGQHTFRLIEGKGMRIYPSLAALRASLRRRSRSTLSEERWIPFPRDRPFIKGANRIYGGIREKSSTLIYGPRVGGKTRFAVLMAISDSEPIGKAKSQKTLPPNNVLVVNFRTPEVKFFQEIRADPLLNSRWVYERYYVHAYSPGRNVTGNQVVGKIWKYIQESRRLGLPIDRIVFDEIESAAVLLPSLSQDSLFWPTIFELCGAEAITVFFVYGGQDPQAELLGTVRSEVDYIVQSREFEGVETDDLKSGDGIYLLERAPSVTRKDFDAETSADDETGGHG